MKPWWLLALAGLAGCSFDSEGAFAISNSCGGDASCSQGVCDDNICIDDSGASVDVAIEVLRGSSDPQVVTSSSWAFAPEPVSGRSSRDLLLPATRQVLGTVRWDGARVPATLRFVRRMRDAVAPLASVPIEVDTLPEASGGDGSEDFDFSTTLVAGETYDVVVLPSSDTVMAPAQEPAPAIRSLPPLYLVISIDDGDPSAPFLFDITFPADLRYECEGINGIGCTLKAQVLSTDGQVELPEAGLQVRAIDTTTGRVVSSIAETDQTGHFMIRISDTAADYLIRVTSSVESDSFPAVSVDPEEEFKDDPPEKRILIDRLARIQATGEVRDKIDRAVPGAAVRFLSTAIFEGSQPGLVGSFSASATTNEDGGFGVELLPGIYSITVTPPEDSDNSWGILSADAEVGEELTTIETLVIPSQLGLEGTVATFSDEPAAGATVLARARPGADPSAMQRSQEVVSDARGKFAMSVDPGLFDMQVKVPAESGFSWFVEPDLLMSIDQGDLRKEYLLEPPIAVYGVIRTSEGEPLPNALVRGYLFNSSDGGPARPLQIAEAVSGEDGSYRLLIAPRLVGE